MRMNFWTLITFLPVIMFLAYHIGQLRKRVSKLENEVIRKEPLKDFY